MATRGAESQTQSRSEKYLTLSLGDETYAIEIQRVREIIGMAPVTAVPRTPDFVKGVINLRGKIIPVMDLRLRFGMPAVEYTRTTCIVIVEFSCGGGRVPMGVIVDAVNEVADINPAEIEKVPSFGVRVDTSFLNGLGRTKSGVKLLLNIDRVLSPEDLAALDPTGPPAPGPAEGDSAGSAEK